MKLRFNLFQSRNVLKDTQYSGKGIKVQLCEDGELEVTSLKRVAYSSHFSTVKLTLEEASALREYLNENLGSK